MKKLIFFLVSMALAFGLNSCEDQTIRSSKISGMYKTNGTNMSNYTLANVYNFKNSNTVEFLIIHSKCSNGEVTVPGHSGWYYYPNQTHTYSYYIDGNKIYIPLDGAILTIVNDRTLVKDGGSTFYKW